MVRTHQTNKLAHIFIIKKKYFTNVGNCVKRATGPVLTSDKEKKYVVLPTTLSFAMRRGKLRIYTLQTPPEVI